MTLSGLGLSLSSRSRYDEFMLRFHHFLKENSEFQTGEKQRIEFQPSWFDAEISDVPDADMKPEVV